MKKTSPCARHFAAVNARLAAEQSAAKDDSTMPKDATIYERYLAKLQHDHLRLKSIQSELGKAELKKLLIPEYLAYIEGVLQAGASGQDDVFTTLMIWTFDAGDYDLGLKIAAVVLSSDMKLPDRFSRTPATMVAEEVANAALSALKADEQFDVDILLRTLTLTAEHDMPDQVRAKLHLAIGRAVRASNDDTNTAALELAKDHLASAIKLHDGCGGKKDLEKTESLLKKHAAPPAAT